MFEEKRREPKDYKKITIKILEISFVVMVLLWGILLLVNYIRFTMDLPPIITVSTHTYDYEDGRVFEYVSLGYIYRSYEREVATKVEFVPFWDEITDYEITHNYPELVEHNVPNNPDREDMVNSVIFYFDEDDDILFTYKCINIGDCEIAESINGGLEMERFNNYVFIKEEYDDRDVVYIVDINKKEIVYEISDIAHSSVSDTGKGLGNDGEFIIVDKLGKYGVIYLSDEIVDIAAPNFDIIRYNEQSDTYVMKSKYFMIKDLDTNEALYSSEEELMDAYRINDSLYMKYLVPIVLTDYQILEGVKIEDLPKTYNVLDESDYELFDVDYSDIQFHNDKFFLIDDDRNLYIKDQDGKDYLSEAIRLDFDILDYDNRSAYQVSYFNDNFIIETLSSTGRVEDTYIFNKNTWQVVYE